MINQKTKGLIYIILGTALLIVVSGKLLLQVIGAVVAFIFINKGMQLRNQPPLVFMAQRWFGGGFGRWPFS